MALPIIDISPFLQENSSLESKKKVGIQVDEACRNFGFFYLRGHGISERERAQIRDLAKSFFELEQQEKEKISISKIDFARYFLNPRDNIIL